MIWTKRQNALKASDRSIVKCLCCLRQVLEESVIIDMMKNETFMSAEEAVEKGFADEVMNFEDREAVCKLWDRNVTTSCY